MQRRLLRLTFASTADDRDAGWSVVMYASHVTYKRFFKR